MCASLHVEKAMVTSDSEVNRLEVFQDAFCGHPSSIAANPCKSGCAAERLFSASSYTFKTRVGQACKQLDTIATSFCRKTLKLVGRTMLLEAMSWLGLLGISWFCADVKASPYLLAPGSHLYGLHQLKPMRRRRKTGTLISMDSEQRCHQIHFSFCMQRIMTSSDKQSQCHSWLISRCPLSCHSHSIIHHQFISSLPHWFPLQYDPSLPAVGPLICGSMVRRKKLKRAHRPCVFGLEYQTDFYARQTLQQSNSHCSSTKKNTFRKSWFTQLSGSSCRYQERVHRNDSFAVWVTHWQWGNEALQYQ